MHKWLRVLICLLLVCCLIVRISPIQAKAAILTGTVAAGTAIAAGLVALGIGVGATETAFNNLVDSLTAVAGSDRVPVWISETADGFVTYLQESFLGSLLAHCFDTGVLTEDLVLSKQLNFTYRGESHTAEFWTTDGVGSAYVATGSYPSDGLTRYDTRVIFYSPNADRIKIDGSSSSVYDMTEIAGSFYRSSFVIRSYDPEILNVSSSLPITAFGYFSSADDYISAVYGVPPGAVSTSEDLTLGSIGANMSSPNYDPWRTAAIPVVPPVVGGGTADEDDALPVTFPGLDTPSIIGQTQAGAQSGITPGTVVEDILSGGEVVPDTGTGTIADVIAAIKAIPASLADFFADVVAAVQAVPVAISEFLTPKAPDNHDKFALADLSKFFPFCIPFDLYDFFTLLNADPVAPVLSWEIKDLAGQTYSLDVDLSQWDSVALLFRRLQLFLFITGLAAASRKFIKW